MNEERITVHVCPVCGKVLPEAGACAGIPRRVHPEAETRPAEARRAPFSNYDGPVGPFVATDDGLYKLDSAGAAQAIAEVIVEMFPGPPTDAEARHLVTDGVPNPGSPAALARGCTCPVLDNNYGREAYTGPGFIVHGNCSVHGSALHARDNDDQGRRDGTDQPG